MRYSSIKSHLRPYSILARRKTTITHAFAAAVASYDIYDDEKLRDAIRDLGQNPDSGWCMSNCFWQPLHKFVNRPIMVCEACAKSRSATKRLMHLAKVVGNREQGHGMTMIYQLAWPSGAKASKASVKRADAQIEAFNVRRANLVHVRLASAGFEFYACAFWLAVTMIRVNFGFCEFRRAINFLHNGEIETAIRLAIYFHVASLAIQRREIRTGRTICIFFFPMKIFVLTK